MDIKILKTINSIRSSKKDYIIIGTHNGIFHTDEIVAIAILCLLYGWHKKIIIVRSRNLDILSECDISVDIGGGKYDHHMPGFSLKRKNGITYASAGLVWKDYGKHLVQLYMNEIKLSQSYCEEIVEFIDNTVIQFVDAEDNGIDLSSSHCMSFISDFLPVPTYFNNTPDFEEQFRKALDATITILEHKIRKAINKNKNDSCFKLVSASIAIVKHKAIKMIAKPYAKKLIKNRLMDDRYFSNNILEIPIQTLPWKKVICKINKKLSKSNTECINFVIYPYPAGGWAAECVPPSLKKKFDKRVPFPKEWAGQTEDLAKISGIAKATFCHNNCFFVRAQSKSVIIAMCRLAMEKMM